MVNEPVLPVEQNVRDTITQRTLPVAPSFTLYPVSQSLCALILSLTRVDRFEVPLVYRKRGPWFTKKKPTFFKPGNIFARYRKTSVAQIHQKLTEAETLVKSLYDTRPY